MLSPRLKGRGETMPYRAEKWTTISSRELWAVLNNAGEPVAFGPEIAMVKYAGELNANNGIISEGVTS